MYIGRVGGRCAIHDNKDNQGLKCASYHRVKRCPQKRWHNYVFRVWS